jgi:hypothetical protein
LKERREWVLAYRPKIEAALNSFDESRERIFVRVPKNKKETDDALAAVAQAKESLRQALELVEKAGPSSDNAVEQDRLQLKQGINQSLKFLDVREKELRGEM